MTVIIPKSSSRFTNRKLSHGFFEADFFPPRGLFFCSSPANSFAISYFDAEMESLQSLFVLSSKRKIFCSKSYLRTEGKDYRIRALASNENFIYFRQTNNTGNVPQMRVENERDGED